MHLLVTGGNGFVGRHVVTVATRRGHTVRVLARSQTTRVPASWEDQPNIEVLHADLKDANAAAACAHGADAVVHLAVAKKETSGDPVEATLKATENLLNAMVSMETQRIILVSSLSVYEYLDRQSWDTLAETSPLSRHPEERDIYCQTKLAQEQRVREHAAENGWRCVVLRPGVIFGRDNLWNGRVGMQVKPRWWVRTGTFAPLPLTYVENCAEAIVKAAEYEGEQRELVLNVVDDETPSQRAYLNELRRHMPERPRIIPIPWTVMRALARTASVVNGVFFRGTAKVPG
ncbi:MAG: NAD-dependent epimerase/dehydratase family protein, partial [Candidatus Hydrogenedentota bacterium]